MYEIEVYNSIRKMVKKKTRILLITKLLMILIIRNVGVHIKDHDGFM